MSKGQRKFTTEFRTMNKRNDRKVRPTLATTNLRKPRESNKAYFDKHKRLHGENVQLHLGDLVLLHNTERRFSRSRQGKLDSNWRGPYRIREIPKNSTYYLLEELDGTPLAAMITGNRLKKFFSRTLLEQMRRELEKKDDDSVNEEQEEDDDSVNEEQEEKNENED